MGINAWAASQFQANVNLLTQNKIVLFVGDSQTAGVGAGNGTGVNPEMTGARPLSYPSKTADELTLLGVPALASTLNSDNANGFGVTWAEYNSMVSPNNLTSFSGGPAAGGPVFTAINSTVRQLTFSPPQAVNALEMWVYQNSSGGSGRVIVDGVTAGAPTFSCNNATERAVRVTIPVPLGVHTFMIERNTGSFFFPFALAAYNSAVPSVLVMNAGMRNFTSGFWTDSAHFIRMMNSIPLIDPDITFIMLGGNDYRNAGPNPATIPQYKANMQAIINKAAENGGKVILAPNTPLASYNTTVDAWSQQAALTAVQELVAANPGSVFFNTPEVLFEAGLSGSTNPADYGSLAANGHMYDSLHTKASVFAAIGAALAPVIKTTLGL